MSNSRYEIWFFILLTLNVLALVGAGVWMLNNKGVRYFLEKARLVRPVTPTRPFQGELIPEFQQLPATRDDIFFAGDSITVSIPWAEFFTAIRNRGIGGDATDGLLRRFDDILKGKPRQIFI